MSVSFCQGVFPVCGINPAYARRPTLADPVTVAEERPVVRGLRCEYGHDLPIWKPLLIFLL